jgi:hypothetical protein
MEAQQKVPRRLEATRRFAVEDLQTKQISKDQQASRTSMPINALK